MSASILTIILASISVFIFVVFLVSFVVFHNKKMIQNKDEVQRLELEKAKKILIDSIQVQEAERARIGTDIHDDLGPTMSAIKLKINNLSHEKPVSERDVSQLKMMINETIKSIRSLSHSLYPNTLEKYGFKTAIEEMANRINSDTFHIITHIDTSVDALDFYTQINLYRILQEFCNNSIKYSKCSLITIAIKKDEEGILITACDDGIGFDTSDNTNHGIGIKNMEMRANAINFSFLLSSSKDSGTKITLSSM